MSKIDFVSVDRRIAGRKNKKLSEQKWDDQLCVYFRYMGNKSVQIKKKMPDKY